MNRRNYAKSFRDFITRILANTKALTLLHFINKFIFERQINKIKTQIIYSPQRVKQLNQYQ